MRSQYSRYNCERNWGKCWRKLWSTSNQHVGRTVLRADPRFLATRWARTFSPSPDPNHIARREFLRADRCHVAGGWLSSQIWGFHPRKILQFIPRLIPIISRPTGFSGFGDKIQRLAILSGDGARYFLMLISRYARSIVAPIFFQLTLKIKSRGPSSLAKQSVIDHLTDSRNQ